MAKERISRVTEDEPAAPTIIVATKGKRTCTVGSKLPFALELRLCRERIQTEVGQHGNSTRKVFEPYGDPVFIRGSAYPNGMVPKGFPRKPDGIDDHGFALTHKVDLDFMQRWFEDNKETDMVRSGLIRMDADPERMDAECAEHSALRSGLDPIDTDGDPRAPKPINSSLSHIKTEQRPGA